ncbi:MAG: hypothetical protein Q8L84_12925 [Hyphomonas sp.]|nr:hypothetical protein [Hyphomonas sp.]
MAAAARSNASWRCSSARAAAGMSSASASRSRLPPMTPSQYTASTLWKASRAAQGKGLRSTHEMCADMPPPKEVPSMPTVS